MKKLLLAIVLLAVAVSPALAFDLGGYTGPVQFQMVGYTDTIYSGSITAPVQVETWGVFQVTSINAFGPIWSPGSSNERIYGVISGLHDWKYTTAGSINGTNIYQEGGRFDLYYVPAGSHVGEFNTGLGPGGRIGTTGYQTISDIVGVQSFLSGVFTPGIVAGDFRTTILQDVTGTTSPVTGQGNGYGDIQSGLFASMFGGDGQIDGNGVGRDIFLSLGVFNPINNPATLGNEAVLWDQYVTDPTLTNVIPEPASMALLGLGLAGLALRRRKAA